MESDAPSRRHRRAPSSSFDETTLSSSSPTFSPTGPGSVSFCEDLGASPFGAGGGDSFLGQDGEASSFFSLEEDKFRSLPSQIVSSCSSTSPVFDAFDDGPKWRALDVGVMMGGSVRAAGSCTQPTGRHSSNEPADKGGFGEETDGNSYNYLALAPHQRAKAASVPLYAKPPQVNICVSSPDIRAAAPMARRVGGGDEPPPLPAAPFVLQHSHVRFSAKDETGVNEEKGAEADAAMWRVFDALLRMGADVEAKKGKAFKLKGVAYVDNEALHFRVKMYRDGPACPTGDLVCEFTKKRGDAYLWGAFFRAVKKDLEQEDGDPFVSLAFPSAFSAGLVIETGTKGGWGGEAAAENGEAEEAEQRGVNGNTIPVGISSGSAAAPLSGTSSAVLLPVTEVKEVEEVVEGKEEAAEQRPSSSSTSKPASSTSPLLADEQAVKSAVGRLVDVAAKDLRGGHELQRSSERGSGTSSGTSSGAGAGESTKEEQVQALVHLANLCASQAQRALSGDVKVRKRARSTARWILSAVLQPKRAAALAALVQERSCHDVTRCAASFVAEAAGLAAVLQQKDWGKKEGKEEEEQEGEGGRADGAAAFNETQGLRAAVPGLVAMLCASARELQPALTALQCRREYARAVGAIGALGDTYREAVLSRGGLPALRRCVAPPPGAGWHRDARMRAICERTIRALEV